MIDYLNKEHKIIKHGAESIFDFTHEQDTNIDQKTVESFGEEWSKFDFFDTNEISNIGAEYFDILPPQINSSSKVLDVGCGTGRWTKYLSKSVGFIEAVDPSIAVWRAKSLLQDCTNIRVTKASTDTLPFADESFDLVFSLGVLHHIPDTQQAMTDCVKKVKHGGYFLVYLYYSLDNRGPLYRIIFALSTLIRKTVNKLPSSLKKFVCDILAVCLYLPFIFLARLTKKLGLTKLAMKIPLSYYIDKSWNVIRNDSLDRFGTPLEQRFSKNEIEVMMKKSGLTNIQFSDNQPYWHAIGQKK